MDKTKKNLTVILLLMIITGFVIYYMYLKPESFYDCITNPTDPSCSTTKPNVSTPNVSTPNVSTPNVSTPNVSTPNVSTPNVSTPNVSTTNPNINNCPTPTNKLPVAIVSRYFGVGFNVYPVASQLNTFLVEHIPITSTGVSGGMYSISSDGNFTIKLRNIDDTTQWWTMTELSDTDNSIYQVIKPQTNPATALQYANGSLSLRPYTAPGFEGQKWLKSDTIVNRGIPVLNYSPASMFTTEFDPYSTNSSTTNNLSDANSKQVSDVVNAVKNGINQFLSQPGKSQLNGQMSSSSLGNKSMPLSVNLNLSGGSGSNSVQGISYFDNVTGSSSDADILSILDKYEAKSANSASGSQTIYSMNDLQNSLNTSTGGCKLLNINDYTPNRVSTCNCKFS